MSLRMVAFQSWLLTYFCSMFAHVLFIIGLCCSSLLAAFLATVICFFRICFYILVPSPYFFLRILLLFISQLVEEKCADTLSSTAR